MKKNFIYIIQIIFIVLFIFVWFYGPTANCSNENHFRKQFIEGRVVNKFLNEKEHLYPTLNMTGTLRNYSFLDKSRFYNFVEIGDSLIKEKGSLDIRLIRSNLDTIITIDYGCEK